MPSQKLEFCNEKEEGKKNECWEQLTVTEKNFYKRPTLASVFTNQKKYKEDFNFMKKYKK